MEATMDDNGGSGTPRTAPRRLARNTERKLVAGVAAGLGDYFGIDPVIFRVGFVVTSVFNLAGLFAYLLAWLVMPASIAEPSPGDRVVGRIRNARSYTWLGLVLLVAGVVWLTEDFDLAHPEIVWAFGLIAGGILLFRYDTMRSEEESAAPPPPPTVTAASAVAGKGAVGAGAVAGAGAGGDATETASTLPFDASARERRKLLRAQRRHQRRVWRDTRRHEKHLRRHERRAVRSPLGYLTMAAVLVAVGIALTADNLGIVTLTPGHALGLALLVVGGGLVVGAWWGTSRGLVAVGLLLLPAVFVASVLDVPLSGGIGDAYHDPRTLDAIRREYRVLAGGLVLDLHRVDFDSQSRIIDVSAGVGDVNVLVPRSITVAVHSEVGVGHIDIFNRSQSGVDLTRVESRSPENAQGEVILNLEAGVGSIRVYGERDVRRGRRDDKRDTRGERPGTRQKRDGKRERTNK